MMLFDEIRAILKTKNAEQALVSFEPIGAKEEENREPLIV